MKSFIKTNFEPVAIGERLSDEELELLLKQHDPVSRPSHYTQGGIECIDAIEAALTAEEFRGYLKGQIFKYGWRLGHKDDPAQEAGKLNWYSERLKKHEEKCKRDRVACSELK